MWWMWPRVFLDPLGVSCCTDGSECYTVGLSVLSISCLVRKARVFLYLWRTYLTLFFAWKSWSSFNSFVEGKCSTVTAQSLHTSLHRCRQGLLLSLRASWSLFVGRSHPFLCFPQICSLCFLNLVPPSGKAFGSHFTCGHSGCSRYGLLLPLWLFSFPSW